MLSRLKSSVDTDHLFLFSVLCGAFVLRLLSLTARSLWLDEFTSIEVASRSVLEIVKGTGFDRHTPPLYYLVLHLWFTIFTSTEFSLRFLSLIFDLFNLWLVFVIATEQFSQFSRRSAQLLAVLYACSPFAIYYAQEGRMYSMLLCLVLITYFLALRGIRGKGTRTDCYALILVGAAGMYTHYYYALSLIGISLGVMLAKRRELLLGWTIALLAIGLCFTPWLTVLLDLSSGPGQTFRRHVFSVLPYTLFRYFAGYGVLPLTPQLKADLVAAVGQNLLPILTYSGLFGAAACLGVKSLWAAGKEEKRLFFAAALCPPVLALNISLVTPMLSERYLIVSFPFALALVALGVAVERVRGARNGFAVILGVLVCFSLWSHYRNEKFGNTQWREAAAYLSTQAPSGAKIYVNPPYAAGVLRFYLHAPHVVYPFDAATLQIGEKRNVFLVEQGTLPSSRSIFEGKGLALLGQMEFPLENGLAVLRFN